MNFPLVTSPKDIFEISIKTLASGVQWVYIIGMSNTETSMNTMTLAQQIADRIHAESKANPRGFYTAAARRAAAQDKRMEEAKIARLRNGGITEND
jgi:hypothetical protein